MVFLRKSQSKSTRERWSYFLARQTNFRVNAIPPLSNSAEFASGLPCIAQSAPKKISMPRFLSLLSLYGTFLLLLYMLY